MQDGELTYRFKRILGLMRDVPSAFFSNGWDQFEEIYPLFIQRFKDVYPNESKSIENCAKKILFNKKYRANDVKQMMEMMEVILEGYQDKERLLYPPKPNKVFISHAEEDKEIVEKFVGLLNRIGLNSDNLFCSSIPGFMIRQGSGDIFECLRSEFNNNLFVVFMLSQNYYGSAECLNEMGAAWILQKQYQTILLPGFDFKDIEGAINPRNISFKLNDKYYRNASIEEFKNRVINFLQLQEVNSSTWDHYRDQFFKEIDRIFPSE